MTLTIQEQTSNRWLKLDALLVLVGITSGLIGNYESHAGEVSKIIPATYAFAIWAPIYISGLYFAWRLLKNPVAEYGLGVHLLAASFFMSGLWVRVQSNVSLELVIVAVNLVLVLWQGHLLSKINVTNGSEFFAIAFPSGTLAGWLTLATAVTFSDGLKISFKTASTVAVFTAFAIGFAISVAKWIVPTLTFRVTLIWGFGGIIAAQYSPARQVAIVAAVGVAMLLGLIAHSKIRQG